LNLNIIKVSYGNVINKIAEKVYLHTNLDFTRPTQIYALINTRCNSKCRMCDSWREVNPEEVPAKDWIRFLMYLKKYNANYNINFSGGEPLLKQDFLEILEYCHNENIPAGFTTNGLLLNKRIVDKLLRLNLFNINISLDSMNEEVHDGIRGVKGMLNVVKNNVSYLAEERIRIKNRTPIIIKPMVCNENLNDLENIVVYAKDKKFTGVNFQPINKWSKESEEMFKMDLDQLDIVIEKLVNMKKSGYPIMNSETQILDWKLHFRQIIPERNNNCVVALRNLTIKSNGDIVLCGFRKSKIGNIKNDDIKNIWSSEQTKKLRIALVNCKKLCTATCVVSRSWKDYIDLFRKLTING